MRTKSNRVDLVLALVRNPRFDEIVGEDATGLEERIVLLECVEGLFETRRNLRNKCKFLGRKVVEVLVDRCRWLDAVLDAVEASHQHRSESEVRIAR